MRLQRNVTNLRRAALRLLAPALLILLAGAASAADRLQMTVAPVFLKGPSENGIMFEISNDGPDAKGVVKINASGGVSVYPIELPRGSRKKFVGYPMSTSYRGYDALSYDLETNRGSVHLDSQNTIAYSSNQGKMTLEIGDDQGSLQFLDTTATGNGPPSAGVRRFNETSVALYAKPEIAPGRLLAYRDLPTVVLGPGSERISDDTVHALTEYVIGGGRLIFVGGAVAPTMRDARWSAILPILNPHAITKEVSLHIGNQGSRNVLSVQDGARVEGSTLSQGGVISRPYGLGEVIVLPFDLLEGPLKSWAGRAAYFNDLTNSPTGMPIVWPNLDFDSGDPYNNRYASYTTTSYIGGSGATTNLTDDPFSYHAPDTGTVGILVFCYLILVAPVNFFILRKLKRSELAWFTTPAISFIFAIFILRLAAGLYLGKMVTAVKGTMLVAENQPVGIFRGTSQLFFPAGGSYDLKLKNVDWLTAPESFTGRSNGLDNKDFVALDVGQMIVPDLNVKNLQFKDIGFEQLIDTKGWFTMGVARSGNQLLVTVANHSPYALQSGFIDAEGGQAPLMSLPSGGSASVKVPIVKGPSTQGIATYGRSIHRAILSGTLAGFRPGPQIGGDVAARNQIEVNVIGDTSTSLGGDQ